MNPIKVDIGERRVFRGSEWVRLTKKQFVIFSSIYYRGRISLHEIFDILYGHDLDGGPDQGVKALSVFIRYTNDKLQRLSVGIFSSGHNFVEIRDKANLPDHVRYPGRKPYVVGQSA